MLSALQHRDRSADPQRTIAFVLLAVFSALLAYEVIIGALPGEKALARATFKPYVTHVAAYREVLALFGLLGTPTIAGATTGVLVVLVGRRCGPDASLFIILAALAVPANA